MAEVRRGKGLLFRTSLDYAETTATTTEETTTTEAQPEALPQTGGVPFPVEAVLLGFGALTAAGGLYLRRRNAA